jgi:hypothetical protein
MKIRGVQIEKDQASYRAMEDAYRTVEPIWDQHPGLLFGEVCTIYLQQQGQAAA